MSGKGLRVLVCGGRDLTDANWINTLGKYDEQYGPFGSIVHGGQTGGDTFGAMYAKLNSLPCTEYKANWQKFGKRAGPIRNQRMLDEGKPDLVIALPGGRGTADMINRAQAAGVPVIDVEQQAWPDLRLPSSPRPRAR